MRARQIRGLVAALLGVALVIPAGAAAASLRARIDDSSGPAVLRTGRLHVTVAGASGERVRVTARIEGGGRRGQRLARTVNVRIGRGGHKRVTFKLASAARKRLRAAIAGCRITSVAATVGAVHGRARGHAKRRLSGGSGCRRTNASNVVVPGQGPPPGSGGGSTPTFSVGAAVSDFTPPLHGQVPNDASDCDPSGGAVYTGPRKWAFMEPYIDQKGSGHYDPGDPYLDCNGNGRWDGNYIGGGTGNPRYYDKSQDPVTSRALVVGNGSKTIAVEVTDQEGLFNVYQQQIRDKVAADGYHLDGIFISATHDEEAPDTLGLGGPVDPFTGNVPLGSGTNDYFLPWFVQKSAKAIEHAYDARRPAHLRFADAVEPANMRQCWSSYPFVDDQIMPVLQAVGTDGRTIATLASVSQHTETVGFNNDPTERLWLSADWPHWFTTALEQRYGGVGIEMAGSVGSVESPQVFPFDISRVPQQFVDGNHPAGCRTTFAPPTGSAQENLHVPLGYFTETKAYGEQLAGAVADAIDNHSTLSGSSEIWGQRSDVCIPLTNQLFAVAATGGTFAHRPGFSNNCTVQSPVAPNGTTSGNEALTQVAAFRIGDGEFIALPGEVFPFTYLRSFLGPQDMPFSQYGLPAWPLPHMNAPYRFFDGLAEDMVGYIFPRGNGVGVPGEDPNNPSANGTDRFGCGHSDDSEAASSQTADLLGDPLVKILDSHGSSETIKTGRYILPDGTQSRDPLGGPAIKCNVDQTYHPGGRAVAAELADGTIAHPAAWMSLDGRPQSTPDRNTRGYFTAGGGRVWLEVFPDLPKLP